jgi:UDPglucose--hexose-1-phosphate uridylyltransferase
MPFQKTRITRPDGRYLWYYAWEQPLPAVLDVRNAPALEAEGLALRWHPLLEEWVVVAPKRQERTFLPAAEYCPLCPTQDLARPTEVPSRDYEIAVFENRFPSFARGAAKPTAGKGYTTAAAKGAAEVVLYSAQHDATLGALPEARIEQLVEVWTDRYRELAERREVQYVFIFENRGEEIGVTLTHPHGQIYGFPFIPPRVARELAAAARYRRAQGSCLQCDLVAAEAKARQRVVAGNDGFLAFVPPFARYPYEVHIVSRRHRPSIAELTAAERGDLARVLKTVLQKYDNLWSRPLPFVMVMQQRPADGRRYPGCHFRIEFTPPYRDRERLKYLAGCETGAGTFINDARPERIAEELRWAKPRT